MVQELTTKQGIFGRLGKGLGEGIAEHVPKEVERSRLASGLKTLGERKGLTPFQQYAGLVGVAHEYPQVVESGSNLLRQQALIDNYNQSKQTPSVASTVPKIEEPKGPQSATTKESTEAALNPYIPPGGEQQEQMARQLMAEQPQVYPTIESARAAVSNKIAADTNQSNARLAKRELEESVQGRTEQKLREEIGTVGADVPGIVMSDLQQQAVDDVRTGKLSPDKAKVEYGKKADRISKDFSNIKSWGNLGLITKNSADLLGSMQALQRNAKEGKYQKPAADALIAENGLTPQFAYATLYPVSDIKPLNDTLKELPNINRVGIPPSLGKDYGRPKDATSGALTTQIAPSLARAMGTEGSPLAISYELDKKGYDSQTWKQYLLDNADQLNLTSNQIDELQKPRPSFFGWLNDWWLKSFTGIK